MIQKRSTAFERSKKPILLEGLNQFHGASFSCIIYPHHSFLLCFYLFFCLCLSYFLSFPICFIFRFLLIATFSFIFSCTPFLAILFIFSFVFDVNGLNSMFLHL